MSTIYALCCRDGLKVEILGFYLDQPTAQADADHRNDGNWYSHFYVAEVHRFE